MTRRTLEGSLSPEVALELLYGDRPRDLTSEGYQLSLRALRRQRPAIARRVERALEPLVRSRAFPRRQISWQDTSFGLRARLLLLPDNPHLEIDSRSVRAALGVDPELLRGSLDELLMTKAAAEIPGLDFARAVEQNTVSTWISAHRHIASGSSYDPGPDAVRLSSQAIRMAEESAHADLTDSRNPPWLREGLAKGTPFDDAVARLCEWHRLPSTRSISVAVGLYVLTKDRSQVARVSFPMALVFPLPSQDEQITEAYESFAVSIGGLDEFITKDDWNTLWTHLIRPRQESLLSQRGGQPQGRRTVDIGRLQSAMPLYRKMVLNDLRLEEAMSSLSFAGDAYGADRSSNAARQAVDDLKLLLTPVDPPVRPSGK